MSATDELLETNEKYAADLHGPLHTDQVRDFVFDVATGRLREVA